MTSFTHNKIIKLLQQELNKRQSQLESAHEMLMRHHEQTHELEMKQQRSVHNVREDHICKQHSTELNNQEEYMRRAQRELKKKHALETKQQPKSLKQKEVLIRKQFRDTCKIQTRQYKALKSHVLQNTPKDEQKSTIRKLKEEQRRKMALLGDQYEQTIAEMLQKQSVSVILIDLEYSKLFFYCLLNPLTLLSDMSTIYRYEWTSLKNEKLHNLQKDFNMS